ncbi:MAG: aminoglycoside phosphotransferase family protein [Opitutaceae bacterium]|jgi:aminoglycoside phosphotransferase (APT) family kinase protein
MSGSRASIYYWKCDRPAAFHGVFRASDAGSPNVLPQLVALLEGAFGEPVQLSEAGGKGNHRTYFLDYSGGRAFVRVEDGPEQDGHLAMESRVMGEVGKTGIPIPRVLFTDASRTRVPFAVQVIEYFDCPDLKGMNQSGAPALDRIASEIGRGVARWQDTPVLGFGPFDPEATDRNGILTGYHSTYPAYFRLQLERHMTLLVADEFLTSDEAADIRRVIDEYQGMLEISKGCLVHKDLALWNIMGTPEGIRAFIDWDDAIVGDPTDDLSLLGCFHSASTVQAAVDGYASIRALPSDFQRRFWLHLLRNMIVKSVIRCGAGYFKPATKGAFLMAAGQDGPAFKQFTRDRLWSAFHGLRENRPLSVLEG